MMSIWNLLWIAPMCVSAGVLLASLFAVGDDDDGK